VQVSILSLVRDAASRLPGGAGTRSDFVLLLYDSQYVIEGLPEKDVILSVSGALDRLQHETTGGGPCVEYDASRKVSVPPYLVQCSPDVCFVMHIAPTESRTPWSHE
jgi:hypothetical protein